MSRPGPYPREIRERAVRMVAEVRPNYESEYAAITAVASKLGITTPETVRKWVRQAQVDGGQRPGVSWRRRPRSSGCGGRTPSCAGQRDPQVGLGFLRGRARPATATLVTYIDEHRDVFGVEPICRVLTECGWPIASSTYRAAKRRPPSARQRSDAELAEQIRRVHSDNCVFGARMVWLTLNRDGVPVARCTIERLMRQLGLHGAIRGRKVRTTTPDEDAGRQRPDRRQPPRAGRRYPARMADGSG